MARNPLLKNNARIDSGHTHCWWVRFIRGEKVIAQKVFSDGLHGGKRKALEKAIAWRDMQWKKLYPAGVKYRTNVSNNTSGTVGVCRQQGWRTGNNGRNQYWHEYYTAQWQAEITVKGKKKIITKRKQFSIQKYGEDGAYWAAVDAREDAIKAMDL